MDESARSIARLLVHHLRLDMLEVRSFEWSRAQIVSRATALVEGPDAANPRGRTLRASDRKLLQSWLRRREPLVCLPSEALPPVASLLLGSPIDRPWLLCPLATESKDGACGVLMLRFHFNEPPDERARRLAALLIEPVSAALEIDRRLHELQTLREKAEADKRSALSRLGRDELTEAIIGADGGLKPVMERVSLVASSDIPVLILGETGSGKEVIARAIHEQSGRRDRPFIRINCGAIPPELVDSELFGHEAGAFTGATTQRRGWFERADEGTLLLDEIGELPLPAQVRFLRVLQEGTFERVGGERPVRVNVRTIAATHRDLPAMVRQGRFREDLWYRIAGFPIVLPPLRERRQDIPELASHLARRAAKRFGFREQPPTTADLMLLAGYDWPGNVRELASVIDRATILGGGQKLEIARSLGAAGYGSTAAQGQQSMSVSGDWARRMRSEASIAGSRDQLGQATAGQLGVSDQTENWMTLDQSMRQHIEQVLLACRGRIEGPHGAARLLDINPHTLRARMRKLGIAWRRYRRPGSAAADGLR
ncbi:MAG: sigma 54-interacting transcriptional regulator [Phycisphaeraceae bacterium]|nr:sigma 54-interacting transcriptional regulator [Phycisphaeraceae bacterium]